MKKIYIPQGGGRDFWLRIPMNNESAGRHLCMDDVDENEMHVWLESGYGGCWTLEWEKDGAQRDGIAAKVPASQLGYGTYAVVMAGKFVNGDYFRTKRQLFIRLVDREDQADAEETMYNEERAYWAGPAVLSEMLSRDGLNTYELWILQGNEGTLEDYLSVSGLTLNDFMVKWNNLSVEVQSKIDRAEQTSINPRGDYDEEVEYHANDLVYDSETLSSYVSLQSNNTGNPVTDTTYWMKVLDGDDINQIKQDAEDEIDEALQNARTATTEAIAAKNAANAVAAQKVAQAQIGYYECNSLGTDATKVTTTGTVGESTYVLTQNGGQMKIRMAQANSVDSNVKLQIGNTTALPLYYNGLPVSASNTWEANEVISVYFDGTYYQASNAQGGSNKKINAYLYGDLKTLAVGQNYEIDESVKTTDKQFRKTTKEIKTLSLSEELAIGDIRTNGNATYRADDTINTYDPEGDYSEHPYALGSFAEYTYTVAAESITAGNITVNGTEVAVEETDNAATIADKIAAALVIDGWTTSVADNVVTVRCNTIGNNTATIVINPDTENTGITVEESSVAGTNVIRKYNGETWANATVAGMVEDGVLVVVDEAWLIANITIQNTVTRDINWYASLDNKDGDFTWEVGNISNGNIVTSYSNRYTIFNKNSLGKNVDSFTIYNGGISGKTFALHYYNGSKYISIGNLKTGDNVINAIGRQQFLILVWDKPTAAQTANCSLRVFTEIKVKDVVEKHEERIADLENNLSVEDIHYNSELYKNADGDFTWKTGNPSNSQSPGTANKYFIVDTGRKIDKLTVYKASSNINMYTCAVVGSSYIRILSGRKSANATIDLSNYNYAKIYCLLYKDYGTPTTEEALAENIELTFDFALDGELASLENRVSTLESSAGALKFTNPVIKIDYPDPDIWNGEDGYWYAYATGNLTNGKKTMYRSANLVNWEDTGEYPFTQTAVERWAALGKDIFWAPEVAKIGDHWNMYISSAANPLYVFTSKQPTSGFNLVRVIMHSGISGDNENIDACVRCDKEGILWMFWSASKGICRIRLSDDGLSIAEGAVLEHVAGLPHAQDAPDRAHTFEAPYLYRRKGYWYLIVSAGQYNNNTYCLRVGRCATLDGTFVDKEGNLMTGGNGSLLLTGSGNFYGPGHNGRIITDKDNKTWMLFHSHWTGVSASARPMCISEVLWDEDGWPYFVNNTLTVSGIGPRM